MLGLYVHIPFCVSKCGYCDFYSLAGKQDRMDAYVEAVICEARRYGGLTFDTLYVGGGTPSLLGARRLQTLMEALRRHLRINAAEATIEANPESAGEEFLRASLSIGFNRISIGVQSLNDVELRKAGRAHDSRQAIAAVESAFRCGFTNVSADAIIGLSGQTPASLDDTIGRLLDMPLTHVSVYCMSVEEGTPFAASAPADLPDDDFQASMYERVSQVLKKNGFVHYEISNFARRGGESLHNLNYWRGGEYIGLGPSAASHLRGRRWKTASNLEAYIENRGAPGCEEDVISVEARAGEEAMLRLRLIEEGIDTESMTARYGRNKISGLQDRLEGLAARKLLVREGRRYRLAADSILVSNGVLAEVLG